MNDTALNAGCTTRAYPTHEPCWRCGQWSYTGGQFMWPREESPDHQPPVDPSTALMHLRSEPGVVRIAPGGLRGPAGAQGLLRGGVGLLDHFHLLRRQQRPPMRARGLAPDAPAPDALDPVGGDAPPAPLPRRQGLPPRPGAGGWRGLHPPGVGVRPVGGHCLSAGGVQPLRPPDVPPRVRGHSAVVAPPRALNVQSRACDALAHGQRQPLVLAQPALESGIAVRRPGC